MIRYLMKNNFKLMIRSSLNIFLFIAGPLVVMLVLSSAFSTLLQKYSDTAQEFSVGYSMDETYDKAFVEAVKSVAAGEGITLLEFQKGDPKKIIENNDLAGFIAFEDGKYVIYQSKDHPAEGKKVEYLIYTFSEENLKAADGGAAAPELTVEQRKYKTTIDSTDYYGIIEVVYFGMCAIICAAAIINNEKKNKIDKRFAVSGISTFKMYLTKLIPTAFAVCVCLTITMILSVVLIGVHWGSYLLSALIIYLSAFAATAFGLMVYYITSSMVVTVIIVFTSVWFMGFFGGSFEVYMYSAHPEILKNISPIYHVNRALVELSCEGKSDYIGSAVIFMTAITVVCSLVSIFAGHLRRRGRA